MKRKVILNEFEFKSLINKIVDYLTNLKDKFLGSVDTDDTDDTEKTNIKVSKSSSSDRLKLSGSVNKLSVLILPETIAVGLL